jgi:hypothetical protein
MVAISLECPDLRRASLAFAHLDVMRRAATPATAFVFDPAREPSPPAALPGHHVGHRVLMVVVGAGSYADLAWLLRAANSSDSSETSNPNPKKDAAILALEAAFAGYGR